MPKAIIIGASSGIGKALCIELIKKGYQVGIAARRGNKLKNIQKQYPKNIIYRQLNVQYRRKAIERIQELIKDLGGLDLLIIATGIGYINHQLNWETEKKTIRTNVEGITGILSWAYKMFASQGGGHIACISSIAGIRGNRYAPAYSSSKAYQIAYLEALNAKSYKEKTRVIITDIRPGFVDTDMIGGDHLFWIASPEKTARQIYKGLRSKNKVIYVTKRWKWIAFMLKTMPFHLIKRL
ncbi:MAG: SDR family NAD(P)-dependent oxidoreductase [Bacteroidota bacterium]